MIKAKYYTAGLTTCYSCMVQCFSETYVKIILWRVVFQGLLPERAVVDKCIMDCFLLLHQALDNNTLCGCTTSYVSVTPMKAF